jgi:hypothetical protein
MTKTKKTDAQAPNWLSLPWSAASSSCSSFNAAAGWVTLICSCCHVGLIGSTQRIVTGLTSFFRRRIL